MIYQVGLVAGCRKARPANTHTSFVTSHPLLAMDTVHDIQKWQNGQRSKPVEWKRRWIYMSFWRQPEEKDERGFVTCTGKDEQQAISKVIYTITNVRYHFRYRIWMLGEDEADNLTIFIAYARKL